MKRHNLRQVNITDGDHNKGHGQKNIARYKTNPREEALLQSLTHHGVLPHEAIVKELDTLWGGLDEKPHENLI